ncbi:MAG: hypothetical protein H9W81_07515 [Enterococcus sp.]|nr:hypothetical protein [Enterococcus sp.]
MTTKLSIKLPLPIDVANNLMLAVGKLYPHAMWEGGAGSINMSIPDSDRFREKAEINEAMDNLELHEAEPATGKISYTELSPDLISFTGPEDIAKYFIPIVESAFNDIGADNYLEYRFQNPETRQRYHLIFQKSDKFTPAELKEQAEVKREIAERKLTEYENPQQYETLAEISSLNPNSILTSAEGNVLVVTKNGIFTVGETQPIVEGASGFSAPYTIVRKG